MGQLVSSETFSTQLLHISETYWECAMGNQDYRQVSAYIGRAYLGSENDVRNDEDDALQEQLGHSYQMGASNYGVERGMIQGMTSDLLLRYGCISENWWKTVSFYPGAEPQQPLLFRRQLKKYAIPGTSRSFTSTNPSLQSLDLSEISVFLRQETAIIRSELKAAMVDMRKEFRAEMKSIAAESYAEVALRNQGGSLFQHQALPPAAPQVYPAIMPAHQQDDDIEMDSQLDQDAMEDTEMSSPLDNPPQDLALDLLRRILNSPTADFNSSAQRSSVEMSLSRKQNFICVLPTGGGKSMTFLLPALLDDGLVSVVMIPNKALLSDSIRKTEAANISCCRWRSRDQNIGDSKVVYVALESMASQAFQL